MQVGYARVSTSEQSLAMQLETLQHHGCTKIFQEVASGAQAERQGLTAALAYVRPGDTLVVWRLDRLGRSLGQLIILMNTLHQQQIGFQSVVEAIDTTTATGQFFFQITGAFAELERNLMPYHTRLDPPPAHGWTPPEIALEAVTSRQGDGAKEDTAAHSLGDVQQRAAILEIQPKLHFASEG